MALLLSGALLPTRAEAASACTGVVTYNGSLSVCHDQIRDGANNRQLRFSRDGATYFFWFGQNVVTARCLSQRVIALASYHRTDRQACPLLNRVKGAIE